MNDLKIDIKWKLFVLVLIAASLACQTPDVITVLFRSAAENCITADRAQYESAAERIGVTPETPGDPDNVKYEVCYVQGQASRVRMIEGEDAEGELEDSIGVQEEGTVDICALLPVDASLVTSQSEYACVADLDSLVGCGECGSTISISRMDTEEMAQQGTVGGNCGNPGFFSRGDSPLGTSGYTCTNISDEEYRDGVAQSYLLLSFSHRNYVISLHTGYPGMEAVLVDLGQETINLIDSSANQ
ncbi:MAG: hypothetical protein JXA25_10195 [Anaerolineales bacterium]|nr:hypothetical protein [Anaerolineales bacterium]